MDIEQQIENLQAEMSFRELSDDGYYLSNQYKEDRSALAELYYRRQSAQNPR